MCVSYVIVALISLSLTDDFGNSNGLKSTISFLQQRLEPLCGTFNVCMEMIKGKKYCTHKTLLSVWFSCFIQLNSVNLLMKITGVVVEAYAKIHMPLWLWRFKSCKLWLSSISVVRCLISLTHIHTGHIGWRWTVLPHIWSPKQVLREAVISRSLSF